MWDVPHSHVWHDSFMCVTWLMHMRDMTHARVSMRALNSLSIKKGPHSCLICVFGIYEFIYTISISTNIYLEHIQIDTNFRMFVPINIYTWKRISWTYPDRYECQDIRISINMYVSIHIQDICMCVWCIDECDMTHGCVQHDSCMYATWLKGARMTHLCVFITCWWTWMNHCGYVFQEYGAAKVSRIDSFAENRLFNRALLQKRPMILSILLTEATP